MCEGIDSSLFTGKALHIPLGAPEDRCPTNVRYREMECMHACVGHIIDCPFQPRTFHVETVTPHRSDKTIFQFRPYKNNALPRFALDSDLGNTPAILVGGTIHGDTALVSLHFLDRDTEETRD